MSIPYLSGHPFLRIKKLPIYLREWRVNPLSIRTPISTALEFPEETPVEMCQSPIYQDTHFYIGAKSRRYTPRWQCVNPLSIRTPISTEGKYVNTTMVNIPVSIPYLSGHPFLRVNYQSSEHCYSQVSIPYLSGHPFLRDRKTSCNYRTSVSCQSPINQDTHFYQIMQIRKTGNLLNVSIPYLSGHPFLQGY